MTDHITTQSSEEQLFDITYSLSFLYKHWKFIFVTCFIVCSLAIVWILRMPLKYTATAKILSSNQSSALGLSRMRAFAAQLGIGSMAVNDNITSPQVYVEVLRSRDVISQLIHRKYRTSVDTVPRTIPEIYGMKTEFFTKEKLDYFLYELLCNSIKTNISIESQVITISGKMRDPLLAKEIVDALIEELGHFNNEVRTSKARDNLDFIEKRLEETQIQLQQAEEALKNFQETNRQIQGSPQLLLELGRLSRDVKVQEEIYLTLTTEHELAKIQEVKEQPVFDVIEQAQVPMKKSGPERKKILVMIGFLSLFISIGFLFVKDFLNKNEIIKKIKKQSELI